MERAADAPKIRSLIIVRPDRVGDVVISTSCLATIKAAYPQAKIYFVADELMRPVLENHPLLAGFISLDSNLENEFRKIDAEAIVHLHPNASCYAAAKAAGIPMRVGYLDGKGTYELTDTVADARGAGLKHEAEYNFDLLRLMGVSAPAKLSGNIYLPERSRETLQTKLPWPLANKKFIVIHAGAHSKTLRWPIGRFLQLADLLESELKLTPVFIGAEPQIEITESRFLNLLGNTDLAELGWLLKNATALVSRDSGPSHVAAAVGCPVLTLFARSERMYGPTRWQPLSETSAVISKALKKRFWETRRNYWRRSLEAITVGEAFSSIKRLITGK